jgi:hypothetical protein
MRNTSLVAHELLTLHLKSFYGPQPCSPPSPKTAKRGLRWYLGKVCRH